MEFVSARKQIAKQGLVEMCFFQELYGIHQERFVKLTLRIISKGTEFKINAETVHEPSSIVLSTSFEALVPRI
jgi:hypothetical protein